MPISKINKLLKESDYLAIACPLTPATYNMINKKSFQIMKSNSVIINTSRGDIINEKDLIDALINNDIQGAALDVFSSEPLDKKSKLFELNNVLLSPHIAGNFSKYQEVMMKQFNEILYKFIIGKSIKNRVCKKRLY